MTNTTLNMQAEEFVTANWDKIVEIETIVNGGESGGEAVTYWIKNNCTLDYVEDTYNPRLRNQIKCCHRGNTFDWLQQYDENDNLLNPLTVEDMRVVMQEHDEYRDEWVERIAGLLLRKD